MYWIFSSEMFYFASGEFFFFLKAFSLWPEWCLADNAKISSVVQGKIAVFWTLECPISPVITPVVKWTVRQALFSIKKPFLRAAFFVKIQYAEQNTPIYRCIKYYKLIATVDQIPRFFNPAGLRDYPVKSRGIAGSRGIHYLLDFYTFQVKISRKNLAHIILYWNSLL